MFRCFKRERMRSYRGKIKAAGVVLDIRPKDVQANKGEPQFLELVGRFWKKIVGQIIIVPFMIPVQKRQHAERIKQGMS